MTRKMQQNTRKAQALTGPSTETINLMATATAMVFIVSTVIIMLFVAPANAAEKIGPEPLGAQCCVLAPEL